MNKKVLTVTLNPALDRFELTSARSIVVAGGKGINVSRALKCLGVSSTATGIIAGENGERLKGILKRENIPFDFVKINGEMRMNITYKNQKRKMGKPPLIDQKSLATFKRKFSILLQRHSVVVFSGANALGASDQFYAQLIRSAKAKNKVTVLDASAVSFLEGLKARPTIIKPNLKEAQRALKRRLSSMTQIKKALLDFQKQGVKIILLTLAGRGAVGMAEDQMWHCFSPKVKISHDVGCGDAFLGGFLSAYLKQASFEDAIKLAVSCGAVNATNPIPGKVTKGAVHQWMKKIQTKKL